LSPVNDVVGGAEVFGEAAKGVIKRNRDFCEAAREAHEANPAIHEPRCGF